MSAILWRHNSFSFQLPLCMKKVGEEEEEEESQKIEYLEHKKRFLGEMKSIVQAAFYWWDNKK